MAWTVHGQRTSREFVVLCADLDEWSTATERSSLFSTCIGYMLEKLSCWWFDGVYTVACLCMLFLWCLRLSSTDKCLLTYFTSFRRSSAFFTGKILSITNCRCCFYFVSWSLLLHWNGMVNVTRSSCSRYWDGATCEPLDRGCLQSAKLHIFHRDHRILRFESALACKYPRHRPAAMCPFPLCDLNPPALQADVLKIGSGYWLVYRWSVTTA